MCPEIILPDVDEEQYNQAGSKFVQMPAGVEEAYFDVEIGMIDWDTPGTSMKVPVTITEAGPNESKQDKISFGVKADGIWKGKEIYRAITGDDMPLKEGGDGKKHPAIDPMKLAGKSAIGLWQIQTGKKGGVGEAVRYPKLVSILAPGSKPAVESLGF